MTIKSEDLHINGVRVEIYGKPTDSPPLLFIDGGVSGKLAGGEMAPRLAEDGWYAVCLNWYGDNGSSALAESKALTRSLLDHHRNRRSCRFTGPRTNSHRAQYGRRPQSRLCGRVPVTALVC